jgi:hypothetical protein
MFCLEFDDLRTPLLFLLLNHGSTAFLSFGIVILSLALRQHDLHFYNVIDMWNMVSLDTVAFYATCLVRIGVGKMKNLWCTYTDDECVAIVKNFIIKSTEGLEDDTLEYGSFQETRTVHSPSSFLKSIRRDGEIRLDCRLLIQFFVQTIVPETGNIDLTLSNVQPGKEQDLSWSGDRVTLVNFKAWLEMTAAVTKHLPGSWIGYINDVDPKMQNVWQRCRMNYVGHWIIVYNNTTISMCEDGIVARSIDEWKQHIVTARNNDWSLGVRPEGMDFEDILDSVFASNVVNNMDVKRLFF